MKFLRLAIFNFEPPIKENSWYMEIGKDTVVQYIRSIQSKDGKKIGLLIAAQVDLKKWPEILDGHVIIPEEERKKAEYAIESAANLLSITEMTKRSISSPTPCVAFIPNKVEKKWLDKTKGIRYPQDKTTIHFQYRQNLDKKLIKNLEDRLDGVALLAEALVSSHATGQFHEFMRLFERAFRLSPRKLINPLADFLATKDYKRKQISDWIYKIRDPATHADKKEYFLLESEIRPVISIIQQAAYDVLFNKKKWRNPSTERRKVFSPSAGVLTDKKGIFLVQGTSGQTMSFALLDEFGSYPRNLQVLFNKLPANWWCKESKENEQRKNVPSNTVVQ